MMEADLGGPEYRRWQLRLFNSQNDLHWKSFGLGLYVGILVMTVIVMFLAR